MEQIERYRGCLLGLAVGDALGTTLEFRPPGTFKPLSDRVGDGPFGLEAGQWTYGLFQLLNPDARVSFVVIAFCVILFLTACIYDAAQKHEHTAVPNDRE